MSRNNEQSIRLKIDRIYDRNDRTILPKLDQFWRSQPSINEEFGKTLIDGTIFSRYPHARESGAVAIHAFLMNSGNSDIFKQSGGLGAVIDMLSRLPITNISDSVRGHLSNLVRSLHSLTENDQETQKKLFEHPNGIILVTALCKFCRGKDQFFATEILKSLAKLNNGRQALLRNNALEVLLSPEMLHADKTSMSVRHTASWLIQRLVDFSPSSLQVSKLIAMTLDSEGNRRIDGYTEIQLLKAFISHLEDLTRRNQRLSEEFTLFSHLIDEIKSSLFESLDHLTLILRCCQLVSKDRKQVDFMLRSGLGIAMQYLVRTDFLLFRKKTVETISDREKGSDMTVSSTKVRLLGLQKKKNKTDAGIDRSVGTLMALALVMPEIPNDRSRNADINIFATECALSLYEDILQHRLDLVSELVSSGMIPALLSRVGRGHMINERFNKPVLRFIRSLLVKVMVAQSHRGEYLPLVSLTQPWGVYSIQSRPFCKMGSLFIEKTEVDYTNLPPDLVEMLENQSSQLRPNGLLDIRIITNTLQSQGVTALFLSNLRMYLNNSQSEAIDSVICLSLLSFSVVVKDLIQTDTLRRLLNMESVCFFPTLSLLCQVQFSSKLSARFY